MTDLTEKYKQKQLKWYEEYYVDLENNGDIKKLYLEDDWCFYDGIVDHNLKHNPYMVVYDKVPSYEEYQKLKESRAELNSDIADKAYENAHLKSEYEKECKRADELEDSYWKSEKENKKLKEYERIVTSYNMKPIDYDIACETVNKLLDEIKVLKEQNAQLKELLKECELWFTGIVGNMNDKDFGEHNKSVPIGNFEHIFKEFSQKIDEVLR